MARSILAIAQEAAQRDNTAPAPTSLFNSDTKIAKALRVAAKDTLREFMRRTGHTGLSEWHSCWALALQPGRYAYSLPPDFLRIIPNTEHLSGNPVGLYGPTSPQAWANWLFGIETAGVGMGWRIKNNAIWFEPVPSVAELVAIEYVSRYPVVSALRAGDYDLTTTPPRANAPFVPRDGHMDLAGFDPIQTSEGVGTWDMPPGWDVAIWGEEVHEYLRRISPQSGIAPLPQVRRPEFEADTDQPAFEDDHVLSLGMTFRLRRALGLDYAEAAAEYEAEMDQKLAHDAGGARAIRLGADSTEVAAYPIGGGRWVVS